MTIFREAINKIKGFKKQKIIKQEIKIWGEVEVTLKNVKTGKIDHHYKHHNTLMNNFIDYIIGIIGHAGGVNEGLDNDIENLFYTSNGMPAPFAWTNVQQNSGHPEIIVLGNDNTPITDTDADLLGQLVPASDHNVFTSREGGTNQSTLDNTFLKISTTYDQTEANQQIQNIGLYSTRLIQRSTILGAGLNVIIPAGFQAWDVLNLVIVDTVFGNLAVRYGKNNFNGAFSAFSFSEATQTITPTPFIGGNLTVGDQLIYTCIPRVDAATIYLRNRYLAGIVLPEAITKTPNHILTVIWMIHFDAQS